MGALADLAVLLLSTSCASGAALGAGAAVPSRAPQHNDEYPIS